MHNDQTLEQALMTSDHFLIKVVNDLYEKTHAVIDHGWFAPGPNTLGLAIEDLELATELLMPYSGKKIDTATIVNKDSVSLWRTADDDGIIKIFKYLPQVKNSLICTIYLDNVLYQCKMLHAYGKTEHDV